MINDDIIELGELISQILALEIDLHSRKPWAKIDLSNLTTLNHAKRTNDLSVKHPFAALQKLKIKPEI